jgi:hypothetical protein
MVSVCGILVLLGSGGGRGFSFLFGWACAGPLMKFDEKREREKEK